jgi:hypothetical protein
MFSTGRRTISTVSHLDQHIRELRESGRRTGTIGFGEASVSEASADPSTPLRCGRDDSALELRVDETSGFGASGSGTHAVGFSGAGMLAR